MKALPSAVCSLVCLVATFLLSSVPVEAQRTDVDWKFFGGTPNDGAELCFYEALSVAHNGDHLRVWIKCLSEAAVSKFHMDDGMTERAAAKIARYYAPPINKVEDIDGNQAFTITIYEEIAANGDLEQTPIKLDHALEVASPAVGAG